MAKLMSVQELTDELNYQVSSAEDQTEDNLRELHNYYVKMFQIYCNEVPNFELIGNKGEIKLIKPEFK